MPGMMMTSLPHTHGLHIGQLRDVIAHRAIARPASTPLSKFLLLLGSRAHKGGRCLLTSVVIRLPIFPRIGRPALHDGQHRVLEQEAHNDVYRNKLLKGCSLRDNPDPTEIMCSLYGATQNLAQKTPRLTPADAIHRHSPHEASCTILYCMVASNQPPCLSDRPYKLETVSAPRSRRLVDERLRIMLISTYERISYTVWMRRSWTLQRTG